jgi:hypothetical protein
MTLTSRGPDWLRLRSADPAATHPALLTRLLADGAAPLSLAELPRSLEQVYLQAVAAAEAPDGA